MSVWRNNKKQTNIENISISGRDAKWNIITFTIKCSFSAFPHIILTDLQYLFKLYCRGLILTPYYVIIDISKSWNDLIKGVNLQILKIVFFIILFKIWNWGVLWTKQFVLALWNMTAVSHDSQRLNCRVICRNNSAAAGWLLLLIIHIFLHLGVMKCDWC